MEKKGLKRVYSSFKTTIIVVIETLVADRQKQINKWLHEMYPSIGHYFDI